MDGFLSGGGILLCEQCGQELQGRELAVRSA
jgi:hypothetical protein